MSTPHPILADFLLAHCTYVPDISILNIFPSPSPSNQPHICAICLSTLASIPHRIIQVNLDPCHHIFDADCLSRYILSGFNKCPLCRRTWFEIPDEVADERASMQARISELEVVLRIVVRMMRHRAALHDFGIPGNGQDVNVEIAGGSEVDGELDEVIQAIDHGVWQEWRRRQSGSSEDARFFNWSSSDEEALEENGDSGENGGASDGAQDT